MPCPETPGSDCSRCDNGGADARSPAFPSPYKGIAGAPVEGVLDVLKIPSDLLPGEYVLGWCVLACFQFGVCTPKCMSTWSQAIRLRGNCAG